VCLLKKVFSANRSFIRENQSNPCAIKSLCPSASSAVPNLCSSVEIRACLGVVSPKADEDGSWLKPSFFGPKRRI